jgi:hypothetical protein
VETRRRRVTAARVLREFTETTTHVRFTARERLAPDELRD